MDFEEEDNSFWNRILTIKDVYLRILKQNGKDFEEKSNNFKKIVPQYLMKDFIALKWRFVRKRNICSRKENKFRAKYRLWLNEVWHKGRKVMPKPGRPPSGNFSASSERTQRRRVRRILDDLDSQELLQAARSKVYRKGKRNATIVLEKAISSPSAPKKMMASLAEGSTVAKSLSPEGALRLLVDGGFTKRQYNVLRTVNREFFPTYNKVLEAKECTYPQNIIVTAASASVSVQSLMEHTVNRLLLVAEKNLTGSDNELTLTSKWGCDGSTATNYKQKGYVAEATLKATQHVFQSCMVPLQLSNKRGQVIWENPMPSSPRFCRPIRLRMVKETEEVTREEHAYVSNCLENMENTTIGFINKRKFTVHHVMAFTMVDAKVCNAITENSSTMTCYICGATPSQFNNLEHIAKMPIKEGTLDFGLSILHARIRIFESVLHLSYRLPVSKWQMRSADDKEAYNKQKKRIQTELRERVGILVDVPKVTFGNTNDGNTSRRFFKDARLASEVTGVNLNLILRLRTILEVISSGKKICTVRFEKYAEETAKAYINLYPWNPMTPTMHKLLVHGSAIIKSALLPIGQLSEEAAEARNKHLRKFKEGHARKVSAEKCNEDVFKRLLLTSDPLISSQRPVTKKTHQELSLAALSLLIDDDDIDDDEDEKEEDYDQQQFDLNESGSEENESDSDDGDVNT